MTAFSEYSRTIPQRLQRTFAPVSDASFDDVLSRLATALDRRCPPSPVPIRDAEAVERDAGARGIPPRA